MVALAARALVQPGWQMLQMAAGIAAALALLPLVVMLDIPVVREVVAFVALFLLPGALLLYLLRLRDIDAWEFLAYACGLSLAVLMALGLTLNGLHGLGLTRPISSVPLAIAVSVVNAPLATVALWRREPVTIGLPVGELLKPYILLPLLPLALVILGAQMVNTRQDNTVLLVAIGVVAILPVVAFVPRLLPERAYPLAVMAMGLTLLLHRSLISPRLTGYDVHAEYFFGNLVLEQGFWDQSIPNVYNSMLSLVLVPPIFSAVADVDLLWVLKVVYPVLFSLMPLALFLLYRGPLGPRGSLLAVSFLMFTQPFYQLMPHMARMELALLYFGLLLLTTRLAKGVQATALRLIFVTALVVSHYSVAYFMMPVFIIALAIMHAEQVLAPRLAMASAGNAGPIGRAGRLLNAALTPNFVSLFVVFAFFWYVYVSAESATFKDAVASLSLLTDNLKGDFLSPTSSQGIDLATQSLTPLREATRYLHFAFQFFMVVGVVMALVRWRRGPLPSELVALALPALLANGAAIFVPYFASGTVGLDRIYVGTLLFLAPFAVTGGLTVFQGLTSALGLCLRALSGHPLTLKDLPIASGALPLLAAGLSLYLLLNTGFVYELAQERPNAIPLSRQWMLANGDVSEKLGFLAAYPADEDFAGGDWLASHRARGVPIYADVDGWAYVLREWIPQDEMFSLYPDSALDKRAYVFLRYLNTRDGVMAPPYGGWVGPEGQSWWSLAQLGSRLWQANIVYTNGSSDIYTTLPGLRD